MNQRSVVAEAGDEPYACPCCRHPTIEGRGQFEICFACGWEDDGQDDEDAGSRPRWWCKRRPSRDPV
ncbi:Cysteine-rich CPCC [Micromonospora yangpuensis]|uniref:Cysteine-rich CPCC n=1 Tax=Micromonospora yangpuensis TaxID=683228 RepID=A0A1C6VFN8_9ACTN|nr:Cysteine-rich CPCC [Micromonospora yangpuensis]